MKKLFAFVLYVLSTSLTLAQVPGTLSYQGILVGTDGLPVADGAHTVTFRFYDVATEGTPIFSRGEFSVSTYKGLFTFLIGSGVPAENTALSTNPADADYIGNGQFYVSVVADGVELNPRIQLSTVPYALHAQNASSVSDNVITSSKIADGAVTSAKITDATIVAADLADGSVTSSKIADGSVTSVKIADGTIAAADLASSSVTSVKIADGAIVDADIASGTITAAKLATITTAGKVSGSAITSGTIGGSTAINTSGNLITSGNIGIGRTSPAAKLDVNGQMILNADNSWVTGGIRFRSSSGTLDGAIVQGLNGAMNYRAPSLDGAAGHIFLSGGGTSNLMVIRNNGNIGIGTSSPKSKLHLAGSSSLSGIHFSGFTADITYETGEALQFGQYNGTTFQEHMRLNSSGNLGIGTTSIGQRLTVSGNAEKSSGGNTWATFSDQRLKKEINDFNDGLDILMKINPVTFKYNGLGGYEESNLQEVGIIAQEIKEIAPYMISTVRRKLREADHEETNLLMYNGNAMTYILVNSIQEQQQQIEKLKAEIEALKAQNEATQSANGALEAKVSTMENDLKEIKNLLKINDL